MVRPFGSTENFQNILSNGLNVNLITRSKVYVFVAVVLTRPNEPNHFVCRLLRLRAASVARKQAQTRTDNIAVVRIGLNVDDTQVNRNFCPKSGITTNAERSTTKKPWHIQAH